MATSKINNSKQIAHGVDKYTFPTSPSGISGDNNKYTVQHNGTAVLKVLFNGNAYSGLEVILNNTISVTDGSLTSGASAKTDLATTLSFSVCAGDEIKVVFNNNAGVKAAVVSVIY